jgi:hypothetical protein
MRRRRIRRNRFWLPKLKDTIRIFPMEPALLALERKLLRGI